jgi:D-sedoheptulose 7-phosphate isomerase
MGTLPTMRDQMQASLRDAERLLAQFVGDPETGQAMEAIVACIAQAFKSGCKVLACGNGGSMADAMHFAEEFSGRFRDDREPYPAIALSDPAHLTCVSNDYGYDHVFSRQVQALGQPGDAVLLLSTSGKSKNLILAAEVARSKGVTVVGCLGKGGGPLAALCDIVLHAPGQGSDRIQELHMLALHVIIEQVEREMAEG